jgi:hypothetical protein
MTITEKKFSTIDRLTKRITILFCWAWLLFVLVLRFSTEIPQIFMLMLVPVAFIPYLLIYNWYVRGILWRKVEGQNL